MFVHGLGELEAVVMRQLWDASDPMTVRDVLAAMDRHPPLAYTTVMTVMDNLHRKRFVTRVRSGRAYVYRPSKPRADYTAELMSDLLSSSGDRTTTLLRFVDHMDDQELNQFKRVLGRMKRT